MNQNLKNLTINDFQTLQYSNNDKSVNINVISNENEFSIQWFTKFNNPLNFHYLKNEAKITILNGAIGDTIRVSDITEEEKLKRVLESLHFGLFDYIKNNELKKIKP